MRPTIEAAVDEAGIIRPASSGTALLSESALATDWNRPEEDAA